MKSHLSPAESSSKRHHSGGHLPDHHGSTRNEYETQLLLLYHHHVEIYSPFLFWLPLLPLLVILPIIMQRLEKYKFMQVRSFVSISVLMSGKCVRPSSRRFPPVNRESRFFTDQFRSCWWESCEYRRSQGHISFNGFHSFLSGDLYISFPLKVWSSWCRRPALCSLSDGNENISSFHLLPHSNASSHAGFSLSLLTLCLIESNKLEMGRENYNLWAVKDAKQVQRCRKSWAKVSWFSFNIVT